MKSSDTVSKLRDLTVEELQRQAADTRESLFKLRLQWAMGQTETLSKMRDLRKAGARIQTIIREKSKEQR